MDEHFDSLKDLLVVLSSEVSSKGADVLFELIGVGEAGFEFSLVVLFGEAFNESSNEVCNLSCIEIEVGAFG